MPIQTKNPATEEVLKTFDAYTDDVVDARIATAEATYESWRAVPLAERKALLLKAADILRERTDKYAEILTIEMGKPIAQARGEVEKCAWVCEHYAEHAAEYLEHEVAETDATESYVQFDPLGIIFAVMPWNYPFWQVFRFAAPALMAGNVGMLKHASNVPQAALAIEEVFRDAGFPEGAFTTLLIGSGSVERVVADDRIKAVTLTGSEYAGMAVAGASGKHLKKTVLELGGSDPFIVLEDADLDLVLEWAPKARLQNNGQSCIAAKRFIVHSAVAEQFIARLTETFASLTIGDPMDESIDIGPIVNESSLNELLEVIENARKQGATVVTGGERVGETGYFLAPTIITDITPEMDLYKLETFGPVASVYVVDSTEEAIRIANDTPFGLGSSIWTADTEQAKELAARIDAGAVFINGMVKSDPRLPFGGCKISGYGRELSHYGMKEFVNVKTVWVR